MRQEETHVRGPALGRAHVPWCLDSREKALGAGNELPATGRPGSVGRMGSERLAPTGRETERETEQL